MKQSESAAREQWMEDAEREIKAYLAGPPLVLKSGNGEIAAIIARHYAARAREVQELVKAAREQVCSIECGHRDCNELRAVLAPFAAKGETE